MNNFLKHVVLEQLLGFGCAIALFLSMNSSAFAQSLSCTATTGSTTHTIPTQSGLVDRGLMQPMSGWVNATTGNVARCSWASGPTGVTRVTPVREIVGRVGGQDVYDSGVNGIGFQLRVRTNSYTAATVYDEPSFPNYVTMTALNGSSELSPNWGYLSFNFPAAPNPQYIFSGVQVRYIRTGDTTPGDHVVSPIHIANVRSWYSSTPGIIVPAEVWVTGAIRVPAAFCSVDVSGGNTIKLGPVSMSELPKVGDSSTPKLFTWNSVCSGGAARTVYATYEATNTVTDGSKGRMEVTGGAQGVELQVYRGASASAEGAPVSFGTRYTLGSSATNPGEGMSVRYLRTGDLKPGAANGGMQVNLSYP